MPKVLIFEGGEYVVADATKSPNNISEISEWTPDAIKEKFIEWMGEEWANEDTGDMLQGGPVLLPDTVELIAPTLAQCVTDSCDGGMTYMVLIPDIRS